MKIRGGKYIWIKQQEAYNQTNINCIQGHMYKTRETNTRRLKHTDIIVENSRRKNTIIESKTR